MHPTLPLLAAASLALSACAAGSGTPAGASRPGPPSRVIESGGETNVYLNNDAGPTTETIPTATVDVWTALVAAYTDLGVEVTTVDPAHRILGNRQLVATRRLAGEALSRYFDCGSAGLTGRVADRARLTIDLYSQLQPEGEGTVLSTHATARAKPTNGTSATYAGCSSTGALEKRISELVKLHLAG